MTESLNAATLSYIRKLADAIIEAANKPVTNAPQDRMAWATIDSIQPGPPVSLTVKIAGSASTNAGVRYLSSYTPTVGDTVYCAWYGSDLVVIGTLVARGGAAPSLSWAQLYGVTLLPFSAAPSYRDFMSPEVSIPFSVDPVDRIGGVNLQSSAIPQVVAPASVVVYLTLGEVTGIDTTNGNFEIVGTITVTDLAGTNVIMVQASAVASAGGPNDSATIDWNTATVLGSAGADLVLHTGLTPVYISSTAGGVFITSLHMGAYYT